jgi:hypothetical protein
MQLEGRECEGKYIRHEQICKRLNEIYITKNQAYGDSFSKMFKELGPISAVTQISHKYQRIVNLVRGGENAVKDEALEDTLMDMANYAIMMLIELEGEKDNVKSAV